MCSYRHRGCPHLVGLLPDSTQLGQHTVKMAITSYTPPVDGDIHGVRRNSCVYPRFTQITHTHTHLHTDTHTHLHTHTHTLAHTYTHTHTHTLACMHSTHTVHKTHSHSIPPTHTCAQRMWNQNNFTSSVDILWAQFIYRGRSNIPLWIMFMHSSNYHLYSYCRNRSRILKWGGGGGGAEDYVPIAHITCAKSLTARVSHDALSCYLSLILKQFDTE